MQAAKLDAPVRDFLAESSELKAAVAETAPWLPAAVEAFTGRMPIPKTVMPFVEKPFFRPPGSYRCVYYSVSEAGPGVVAMKGLEPSVPDFDALLRDLQRACYSPHNIAEHLVFEEGKIPGCVGLREAIREAERACAIQRAHLRAYGSLAHLPIPLLVLRHSEGVLGLAVDTLRRYLSPAAFQAIEPILDAGIGIYVYYYPAVPMRVRDIEFLLDGLDFRTRALALVTRVCDPDDVICCWVRGFVRMLYLGFLPGTLSSFRSGICCQPQNACIDGGFVDLDSLTTVGELKDDTALYAALQFSMDSLVRTVRTLVAGSSDPTRPEGVDVRVDLHYFSQYVSALVQEAIEAESRPGLRLDPRILRYFTSARTVADLVNRLGTYYSPKTDFDAATREFGEFGLSLLQCWDPLESGSAA